MCTKGTQCALPGAWGRYAPQTPPKVEQLVKQVPLTAATSEKAR